MKNIKLSDYTYNLPSEKIAKYGLDKRDNAKLLFYKKNEITHHKFYQIKDLIPANSTLFFNNTKVIQARLILKRDTGAIIEVFLLAPENNDLTIYDTLIMNNHVVYRCMIGNLKKWLAGETLKEVLTINKQKITLCSKLVNKEKKIVEFSWDEQGFTFGDILDAIGHTPLPPYLKRPDEENDKVRYQTVYSKLEGAVAAPTAGLHFTKELLESLTNKGIELEELTLHVSAGTFQPIKVENVSEHNMHSERIIITTENLKAILSAKMRIAVGTTAMRTLESTYWYGVKLLLDNNPEFKIEKLAPYQYKKDMLPDLHSSIEVILDYMKRENLTSIIGDTEIFIMPGYKFKVCQGLITNFHQPGSTLILLVAAFVGENWQKIYKEALVENYRFLSYGDSSFLISP